MSRKYTPCIDCGGLKSAESIRCLSCAKRFRTINAKTPAERKIQVAETRRRTGRDKKYYELTKNTQLARQKAKREALKNDQDAWNRASLRRSALLLGIDPDVVLRHYEEVGNVCDACGATPADRRVSVDHDHLTGLFRGFLCNRCNLALGHIEGLGVETLEKLLDYLHRELYS